MKRCACGGPASERDRLRCGACHHWRPQGNLLSRRKVSELAAEAASLLSRFAREDYPWAHSMAWTPRKRDTVGGGQIIYSDPTLNAVENGQTLAIRDWAVLAARLLERAVEDLRVADAAIGFALLTADDGPDEHHAYVAHDAIPPEREDLKEAHAARDRRRERKEDVPS